MSFLLHAHSGLRWIILILLVVAIFNALAKKNSGTYSKGDKMINLFTMISLHIQLLVGFGLYFISNKVSFHDGWMGDANGFFRFYGLEHLVGMLIAIAVITIGRKKAEAQELPAKKHGKIIVWYLIGLIIIFASIPWPFRSNLGVSSWF